MRSTYRDASNPAERALRGGGDDLLERPVRDVARRVQAGRRRHAGASTFTNPALVELRHDPRTSSLFGSTPTNSNTPETASNSSGSPVVDSKQDARHAAVLAADLDRHAIPVRLDLLVRDARAPAMHFVARSSSRRWTRWTLLANFVRNCASSTAASPPPIDGDLLVAEQRAVARRAPRHAAARVLGLAGDARCLRGHGAGGEDDGVREDLAAVVAELPVAAGPGSMASTASNVRKYAPNFSACSCMSSPISGPEMPSGKPG